VYRKPHPCSTRQNHPPWERDDRSETALRSRRLRDKISFASTSAVSTPTPKMRPSRCTSCGGSPVATMRHSTISSLRANATIIVLRMELRPSTARFLYHCANSLFGWNLRKRHANWIKTAHLAEAFHMKLRGASRRQPAQQHGAASVRLRHPQHDLFRSPPDARCAQVRASGRHCDPQRRIGRCRGHFAGSWHSVGKRSTEPPPKQQRDRAYPIGICALLSGRTRAFGNDLRCVLCCNVRAGESTWNRPPRRLRLRQPPSCDMSTGASLIATISCRNMLRTLDQLCM
jgi:hypothetical protein